MGLIYFIAAHQLLCRSSLFFLSDEQTLNFVFLYSIIMTATDGFFGEAAGENYWLHISSVYGVLEKSTNYSVASRFFLHERFLEFERLSRFMMS